MNTKVFMIGWEYPPNITGGLGIACQGLAFALAKKNISVQFMVPKLFGYEKSVPGLELFDILSKKNLLSNQEIAWLELLDRSIHQKEIPSSVYGKYGAHPEITSNESLSLTPEERTTRRSSSEFKGGYTSEIFSEIYRYAAWAAAIASKLDFDVIHIHDWMTFPAGLEIAHATGKPLVCHVHSTEFDRSGEHVNQRIYDMERDTLHQCNAIITVSDFTKSILVNRYDISPEKIRTVHNGVEFELSLEDISAKRSNRAIAPQEKLVLFLGRMTFQKGPDYFVRAAKIVIEAMPNVRFIMAGTGDMYHRMIEMAADMGIGKYFHYTGFLKKDQVTQLLHSVDLYIMPSVSEPFGIVSLEAMMHEVPVIMSKQSGVSEVITNCIKVDFWNVDEIAEKTINILQSSALHSELKSNGKSEAISISWEKAADKIMSTYKDLLAIAK